MTLPTAEDFGLGPLDEKSAREHFLGRTPDEAEAMFREKPFLYFRFGRFLEAPPSPL